MNYSNSDLHVFVCMFSDSVTTNYSIPIHRWIYYCLLFYSFFSVGWLHGHDSHEPKMFTCQTILTVFYRHRWSSSTNPERHGFLEILFLEYKSCVTKSWFSISKYDMLWLQPPEHPDPDYFDGINTNSNIVVNFLQNWICSQLIKMYYLLKCEWTNN